MPSPTRRGLVAGALWLGASATAAQVVACGLPQGGLGESGDDAGRDATAMDGSAASDAPSETASSSDGGAFESSVPPSCTTLDAACLGAVPTGWQPVAVSDAGCAAGFTPKPLLANPRLPDGGCACGACQIVGAFACNAVVAISGGDNCADPTLVTVTPGSCAQASAQHVEAHPPQATGAVSCFAPNDAGVGVITDSLTLCVPGCSVDFCKLAQPCIESPGDLACPVGFTLLAKAGTGADPGCAPCGCDAGGPGACGGTVTAYDNGTCADSGAAVTYPVGTCNQYSTTVDYQSLLVDLVPPTPSCTSAPTDDGDASLTGVTTVCCR